MNFLRRLFGLSKRLKINNGSAFNENSVQSKVNYLLKHMTREAIVSIWNTRGITGINDQMMKYRPRPNLVPPPKIK